MGIQTAAHLETDTTRKSHFRFYHQSLSLTNHIDHDITKTLPLPQPMILAMAPHAVQSALPDHGQSDPRPEDETHTLLLRMLRMNIYPLLASLALVRRD